MTKPDGHFDISYGFFRPLLSVMGMGPRWSAVDLGPDEVVVRMGWAFRAVIPRSAIRGVAPWTGRVGGIGVHGKGGGWLVNGSTKGIVTLDIDPPAHGHVMGISVRLGQLSVSLTDPEGFMAAVGA